MSTLTQSALCGLCAALAVAAIGCSQSASPPEEASTPVAEASGEGDDHEHADGEDHSHGGWWCVEHGIPEEECSMCSAEAAAEFQAAGDWCDEHNRAESQCFICDPTRAEKYAKLYEAKYGEPPPEPTE